MTNQQVAWVDVLAFVQRLGVDPATTITAGTPAWSALPDEHPDKLAAVLAAGVHHALRIDTEQEARAEASRDVAAAIDIPALAQRISAGRGPAYIERRKAS